MQIAGGGKHLHWLGAECPADAVNGVAPDVQEAASRQIGLKPDVARFEGLKQEGECANDASNGANPPAVDELPEAGGARVMGPHEAVHELDPLGLAKRD